MKSRGCEAESRSSLARRGGGVSTPRNAASCCDAAPHGGPGVSHAVADPGCEAGAAPGPKAAAAAGAAAGEDPRRRGDRRRVRRPRPAPRRRGGVHRAPAQRAARGQLVAPRGRRRGRGRGRPRRGERDHRRLRAQADVVPRRRRQMGHLRRLRVPRRRCGNACPAMT